MRHLILCILFLFILATASAQKTYFGFTADTYMASIKGHETIIKKPIGIVYNDSYCALSIAGQGTQYFKTRAYSKDIRKGGLHTSFVNDETDFLRDGYYMIIVDETSDGTYFQVVMPAEVTLIATKVKKYNSGGEVKGRVRITEDSTALARADSTQHAVKAERLAAALESKREDSIYGVRRDSMAAHNRILQLQIGNNLNKGDFSWVEKYVSDNLKIDKYCYGDIKVIIDAEGNIINVEPIGSFVGKEFIPQIVNALQPRKATPFTMQEPYPSYAFARIYLEPKK